MTTNIGTATYLSPEQEHSKSTTYNEKVDMFALGLILCEMCSVFSTSHEKIQTLGHIKATQEVPKEIKIRYPVEAEIIRRLLDKDPNKRPSADFLSKDELMARYERARAVTIS